MDTLIEQSICRTTRCYTCGGLVYAVEKKMTTNHVYHNRCFRCRICKRNLTGLSLNEEGDDIYCANCYQKKQRGDCNSLQFQRAAAERAQYVYVQHHPDQESPLSHPGPPIRHHSSRHPSVTLHRLERLLSYQEPSTTKNDETKNKRSRKFVSVSEPLTIKTSFLTPINPTKSRHNSSLSNDESSSIFSFSPVFSPYPNTFTPTTPKQSKKITTIEEEFPSININKSRLNQSHKDLTNFSSPSNKRKTEMSLNLNQNKDKKENKFHFPDVNMDTTHRRSKSATHTNNLYKIK